MPPKVRAEARIRVRMLFHSLTYLLIFLPVVVAVNALLRYRAKAMWAQAWLIFVSLVFYTRADSANLPLLLGSILFNWGIAQLMTRQNEALKRRLLFLCGLAVNIVLLFIFKYIHLFLDTLSYLGGPQLTFPDWGFPLGVSFFTLIQIMYLVDAYPRAPSSPAAQKLFRGLLRPSSLFDHAAFVTFFPYLVSGPIARVRLMVPQLKTYTMKEPPSLMACRGLFLFSMGLAKKVVLGDSFGTIADAGFAAVSDYSMLEAWAFSSAALFHLYFDFSGYSDMALGAAWMLGIDIPQNFNAPLRAPSISEFWQRWHISLSSFITEYLYNPLSRLTHRPTLITSAMATIAAMTIAALWHGPAWTFLAWGGTHGFALVVNQIWKKRKLRMPDWLGWLLTFAFLSSTVAFLRTATVHQAVHMMSRLVPHDDLVGVSALHAFLPNLPTAILGLVLALFFRTSMENATTMRPSLGTAHASALLLLISLYHVNSAPARQFVYFAF